MHSTNSDVEFVSHRDWIEQRNEDGQLQYFNIDTYEVSVNRPISCAGKRRPERSSTAVSPGQPRHAATGRGIKYVQEDTEGCVASPHFFSCGHQIFFAFLPQSVSENVFCVHVYWYVSVHVACGNQGQRQVLYVHVEVIDVAIPSNHTSDKTWLPTPLAHRLLCLLLIITFALLSQSP